MEQQTVEPNLYSMDNIDFTLLANTIQSSLPTEEINTQVRYDYNTLESFYEIDVEDMNMTLYPEQIITEFLDAFSTIEQLSNIDGISEFLTESTQVFHPIESDDMTDPIQSSDVRLAMIKSNDPSLPVSRPHTEKLLTKIVPDHSILLSQSVAVTVPTPNQLQFVYPLEDIYRARYKSDYFPQSGSVRRPRYVSDNAGNHLITLQMPTEYNRDFANEYIRVALITTSINNSGHFYSPYKFQTNHNDSKVPDQNPYYIPVKLDSANNSIMKLQLVLIKSKLDQLNHAQPLQPFSDTIGHIQNIIHEEKLTPKELINRYQLDKSHIAFTLCTKLPNGSYDIHPETTAISSVITEATTKSSATSATDKSGTVVPTTSGSNKKVRCPHCANCFDLTDANITEGVNKRKSVASTSRTTAKSTTNNSATKKKKKA